jgi:hypothetical protein
MRRIVGSLLVAACLSGAALPDAAAQDKASAEALFQEGKRLMAEGKNEQACPKFVESQKQDPSPGTLLNLGRCHEAIGKTASAWAEYKEAASMARTMNRAEQEAAANERAVAIEPKLSRLKIEPPAVDVPGLTVKRSGVNVGVGSLSIPIPVDPGEHTIEASAPGYKTWTTKITVGPNGDQKMVLIGALEKGPAPPPGPAPGPGEASGAIGTTTPDVMTDDGGTRRTLGFVIGGVGIGLIGAGAVFGLLAAGQAGDAEDDPALCPNKQCSEQGANEIDGAETKALISTIGFGAGAAAVVAGVVLIATSNTERKVAVRKPTPRGAQVIPALGPSGGGLSVRTSF